MIGVADLRPPSRSSARGFGASKFHFTGSTLSGAGQRGQNTNPIARIINGRKSAYEIIVVRGALELHVFEKGVNHHGQKMA